MKLLKRLFSKQNMPLILFHVVFLLVFVLNFPFHTFFTGWDAIHPEFNFSVNFTRGLFSFWQENYGLGTMTGHGFAATLPHTYVLYLLSFVIPVEMLRSVFTFLCLYIGGIGSYFLIQKILSGFQGNDTFERIYRYVDYISLLGALYYMFNLGVIMIFYVQLEPFIAAFASLPWLFLSTIYVLEKRTRKRLLAFLGINIFASIQAFVPPVFLVYAMGLAVFLFIEVMLKRRTTPHIIKTALFILILTFIANLHWILPVGYFTLQNMGTRNESYVNIQSTNEFIARSKKYGDLKSVALLKGFTFDTTEGVISKQPVFSAWVKHHGNIFIEITGVFFFIIVMIGVIGSFFKKKTPHIFPFVGVFFICIIGITTNVPPFSLLTDFLQTYLPIYKDAFRVPFTKFIMANALMYAIFFALGIAYCISFIKKKKFFIDPTNILLLIGVLLLFYIYPIFTGNLLSKALQIKVPAAYFELMNYFKDQPDGRIADFPQDMYSGWFNYSWGYVGSGFTWYGIDQPILSRTFDVWNSSNENYFWEMNQVLREQDYKKFNQLVEKYEIRWIVYDQNLLHWYHPKGFLHQEKLLEYLNNSNQYKLVKTFKGNEIFPIYLYENLQNKSDSYVSVSTELPNIEPIYKWNDSDVATRIYGNYISDNSKEFDAYFPFRSLFTKRTPLEKQFQLNENDTEITISNTIPTNKLVGSTITLPDNPKIQLKENSIKVIIPKLSLIGQSNNDFKNNLPYPCYELEASHNNKYYIAEDYFIRLISKDGRQCLKYTFPQLETSKSYLVRIISRHIYGEYPRFYITNQKRVDYINTFLEPFSEQDDNFQTYTFILNSSFPSEIGYDMYFENVSFNSNYAVNDFARIEIYPLPYEEMASIQITKNSLQKNMKQANIAVKHPNPVTYIVNGNFKNLKQPTIVLQQSYHSGWNAYSIQNTQSSIFNFQSWKYYLPFLFGKKLEDHVLVNNWANGWSLPPTTNQQPTTIVILFWPQYLEYLGFLLLIGAFLYVLRYKDKD